MDSRLLDYYNVELKHLREMGAEFAREFPKIADRLGMSGLAVSDPYVERLIQGVAFLAARVHLKLDAEFPRFTEALLQSIYPHYLAPTPSMLMAQFTPKPDLADSRTIPALTTMTASARNDQTECRFRTAHDVTLWPIRIPERPSDAGRRDQSVRYFTYAPDLRLNGVPLGADVAGGLRIQLECTAGMFRELALDTLPIYLSGEAGTANKLYELALGSAMRVMVVSADDPAMTYGTLPGSAVKPVGFADSEALLPTTLQSFQGYRLLQEYFSFPERFRFFRLTGLKPVLQQVDARRVEIVILFSRGDQALERMVDASNCALFCTPAINLFAKRPSPIPITETAYEYHVVADRNRTLDFEIYQVTSVTGYGTGSNEWTFRPLYAAYSSDTTDEDAAYFTARREPRVVTEEQRQRIRKSSYVGTEVFLSLVDANEAPFSGELRQLSVETLCSNRGLVMQLPLAANRAPGDAEPATTANAVGELRLDIEAPVKRIQVIAGPTRPRGPLVAGATNWRAVNHLALNYLSLVNSTSDNGAAALRDLLQLYVPDKDDAGRRQVDGVRAVEARPAHRRVPASGPIAFGRGVEITVDVHEQAFEGGSAFMFGSVLDHYFARHVSINSFTELRLRPVGSDRIIHTWPTHWGARPTL